MNRHRVFGAAATLAVVIAVALGFWNLGGRGHQRAYEADQVRVENLGRISMAVDRWYVVQKKLPGDLKEIPMAGRDLLDPETKRPYEYLPSSESRYQLCAIFALENSGTDGLLNITPYENLSFHPAGRHCFGLNANVSGVAK